MIATAVRPLLAGAAMVLALAAPSVAAAADTQPPTAPSGVRVTDTTVSTASLAWNPSTDDSGSISAYRVFELVWDPNAFEYQEQQRAATPGLSATVPNLLPDRSYFSGSSTVTFTTLVDREAPTAPTNLQGTVSGIDGFFRWQASTDNSGEARYELYLDDSATPFARADFSRTEVTLFPLELPPGTHQVTVRARDRARNLSGPSNAVTITV